MPVYRFSLHAVMYLIVRQWMRTTNRDATEPSTRGGGCNKRGKGVGAAGCMMLGTTCQRATEKLVARSHNGRGVGCAVLTSYPHFVCKLRTT